MSVEEHNVEIGAMYRRASESINASARTSQAQFARRVNNVGDMRFNYVGGIGDEELVLDGKFSLEQLIAIVQAWQQYLTEIDGEQG